MNEETAMSRWVVYLLDGDPEAPCYANCLNSTDMGPYIVTLVGEGNPYYPFTELPIEILLADPIGVDFNGAPLASADWQTNRNAVAALFANPPPVGITNDGINKVWVG